MLSLAQVQPSRSDTGGWANIRQHKWANIHCHSQHNLAVLRHMALNVMQKDTTKGSLRGKFMRAGWDDRYLARLLALF